MKENFLFLIEKFNLIPKLKDNYPTFMEISGYPHYENVCSNIIAFFLDSTNPHEYDDLFIRSLLECASINPENLNSESIQVYREFPTKKGFIDILVSTEDTVIIIENKIWAQLYNNLNEYSSFVEKHNDYKDKTLTKIVLSLNKIPANNLRAEFINITLEDYMDKILANIGPQISKNKNLYLPQIIDFIDTIKNLKNANPMNEKMLEFFIKEKESINALITEHENLKRSVYDKIKRVQIITNELLEEVDIHKHHQWIWHKHDLVHDFHFDKDLVISVDTDFTFEGIEIKVWVRKIADKTAKLETLNRLTLDSKYKKVVKDHFIVIDKEDLPLQTEDRIIAGKIIAVLSCIKFKPELEVHGS